MWYERTEAAQQSVFHPPVVCFPVFFFDVLIFVNRFKISNSCKLRWKSSRGSKLATTVWRACTRSVCFYVSFPVFLCVEIFLPHSCDNNTQLSFTCVSVHLDNARVSTDKHTFFNMILGRGWSGRGSWWFCVSVAGAHCLKIKGLRSKALTTAVWLLHILGYSAQILLREIHEAARMCAKHFFIPDTFPLLALTDHVYWRCGTNPGWDPGVNWISKGKCLLDVSQIHLHSVHSLQ